MAKPTKHATLICTIMTAVAIIGIVLGIVFLKPIIIVACLLPAVVYEVYRTEGESTRWASWVLLLVIILEIVLIAFNINFDLGQFFGESSKDSCRLYGPAWRHKDIRSCYHGNTVSASLCKDTGQIYKMAGCNYFCHLLCNRLLIKSGCVKTTVQNRSGRRPEKHELNYCG